MGAWLGSQCGEVVGGESGAIEILAKEAARECGIGGVGRRQEAGGAECALKRGGFLNGGDVGVAAVEDVEVRDGFEAAVTAVEVTGKRGGDDAGGEVEVSRTREELREGLALVPFVAPRARFGESSDESRVGGGILFREAPGDHEHFLDVAGGLGGAPGGAPAGAFADGESIPRFAGAVAVDGAGGEVAEHLGRRDDDDADVALGIEPGGKEPVAEEEVMRRKLEDDAERQRLAGPATFGEGGQGRGIPDTRVPQAAGQGQGVTVEIEDEGCEHIARDAAEAELSRPEHGGGGVGRVEFAVDDFFADGGPADFAAEFDAQAVFGEEAEVRRDGEGGGIGESEKADAQGARGGSGKGRRNGRHQR